jgi:hypothetical protein
MNGCKDEHSFKAFDLMRLQRNEAEVLAAIQQASRSTDDLVMVCNMGRHEVLTHLHHLLDAGRIEHEKATSNYGGWPHKVWTGRYRAAIQNELKCAEMQAVSA